MVEPSGNVRDTFYRGLVGPLDRSKAISRRLPTPGPHGRPETPTPPPLSRPETRVESFESLMSEGELTRQRSRLMRQRYQQIEVESRATRPVMLPAVRSFSYDLPTQIAEMEAMTRAQSSSPVVQPHPETSSPPVPLHQERP